MGTVSEVCVMGQRADRCHGDGPVTTGLVLGPEWWRQQAGTSGAEAAGGTEVA